LRALERTRLGVALLVRSAWLEGQDRYRNLFGPCPPAAVAQFCERVPMHAGRWEPRGKTATAYSWVVWVKSSAPQRTRFVWIPPGQREALERPDDVRRFGAPQPRLELVR
jgi:hypothetical protein